MLFDNKLKFKKTLSAIDAKSAEKINKEKVNDYNFFSQDDVMYIVLDKKLDGYELYEAILKKFAKPCKEWMEINVDLDSFLEIVNDKYHDRLLMCLVSAFNYVSVVPWTLKSVKPKTISYLIYSKKINEYKNTLQEYQNVAEAQTFTRRLQDMPSNYIYPGSFVEEIKEKFKSIDGVKITVLDTNDLKEKKMNLLLGVGQAASGEHGPKLLVMEYNNSSSKDKYAFIGKGVCFDAGGYNIKTAGHMRWMKMDMSGAAIVSGALLAIAKNKVKTNLVVLCPLVLNLLNEKAQKPDDVVISYSGKSVEIDNTDAEGRLILADSLTYAAKDLKATHLFDVATLTGAMIYSLGETFTGTWATSDLIWNKTLNAAKEASEQVWRLPFHREFLEMLTNSKVADILNSCTSPAAGSSRAACFLKEFTLDKEYVHFDVAATADKGNVGTGIILRTLYNISKSQE